PEANRRRLRLSAQQVRNYLLSDELPRPWITKEGRDIDQDRVEEDLKFFWVDLEVVDVVRVLLDIHRLHPLVDATLETRRLIAGEVEAAAALQVVDQGRETRCRPRGHAARCSCAK